MNTHQGNGKHHSALKQERSKFRTVVRRVRQDQTQRGSDAIEIRLEHVEISAEGVYSLAAQPACHLRSETLLRAEEPEIGFLQEAQHRAVAVRREIVQPLRCDREYLMVGAQPADQK